MPTQLQIMEKRRGQEEVKRVEEMRLIGIGKVTSNAQWENDTDKRIGDAQQKQYYNALQDQESNSLDARRRQLAALYEREITSWKTLIENSKETTSERKAAIRARAEELRNKREAGKAEYVAIQRRKQWRDSCDDLRMLDSQATLNEVARRRAEQLTEKQMQQQQEQQDESQWTEAWEMDRLRKEQREQRDYESQRVRDLEMRRDLDLQCTQRKERLSRISQSEAEAAEETKQRWEQENMVQRNHEKDVKEALRAEGRRVFEFNNLKQAERAEQAKEEMSRDLILLQVALEKERRELEDEEEKQAQEKMKTKMYQKLLKEQMVKEKEDDSLLEELRRQDEERSAA